MVKINDVTYVNGKIPKGSTANVTDALLYPKSNPKNKIIVIQIVTCILKKSKIKLPIQYADIYIPEITYKCFKPLVLSTTR